MCCLRKKPKPKIKCGDFTFLKGLSPDDKFKLHYDYEVIFNDTCLIDTLKLVNINHNPWDTPEEELMGIYSFMCPVHTKESLNISLKILIDITLYGWDDFVEKNNNK